mgnify:CR=1 FL=1
MDGHSFTFRLSVEERVSVRESMHCLLHARFLPSIIIIAEGRKACVMQTDPHTRTQRTVLGFGFWVFVPPTHPPTHTAHSAQRTDQTYHAFLCVSVSVSVSVSVCLCVSVGGCSKPASLSSGVKVNLSILPSLLPGVDTNEHRPTHLPHTLAQHNEGKEGKEKGRKEGRREGSAHTHSHSHSHSRTPASSTPAHQHSN